MPVESEQSTQPTQIISISGNRQQSIPTATELRKSRKGSSAKKHATIENVSVAGVKARMAPLGLILYSKYFLLASQSVPENPDSKFSPARTYLVCHALELALKAYLSLKGHSLMTLSEGVFGHDLKKLLSESEKQGLSDFIGNPIPYIDEVDRASIYYKEKVFEYPAIGEAFTGYPHWPNTALLLETAEILVNKLYEPCLHAE